MTHPADYYRRLDNPPPRKRSPEVDAIAEAARKFSETEGKAILVGLGAI